MGPFGTAVGAPGPGWSDVQVRCSNGDSRIAGGSGEPATKAEIDRMLMQLWKEFLAAREAGDRQRAEAAAAERERVKAARGYAPQEAGPLSEEQCQELAAGLRELSHQLQTCDQNGWQSSNACRELAATFFHCSDPTVSLTTGDYSCGGKPTQAELDAAAETAYSLCSALRRGGGPDSDPCKPIAFDDATVRSVMLAREVCNNPYAHWDGTCGEPGDLGAWLDGLVKSISPSVTDTLDEMCVKLGQSECPRPTTGEDPYPDADPRPGPKPQPIPK
jgi:hypothetical protein